MPLKHKVQVSWDAEPDPARARWDIVVWPGDVPPAQLGGDTGVCIAHACAMTRSLEVELEAGDYYLGVLPVSKMGMRLPFPGSTGIARLLLTGNTNFKVPAVPTNISVAAAPTDISAILSVDAKAAGDAASRLEVIEGPSADQGVLIADLPAPRNAAADTDGAMRSHSFPIPLDGHGGDAVRTLFVRSRSPDGRVSTATQVNAIRPSRYGYAKIAVMEIVGTSRTGVGAPGSSDGWELDGTDGVRLRAYPAFDAGTGSFPDSLMDDLPCFAKYVNRAVITSDEKDFGHKLLFSLDAWGQWRRKSSSIAAAGDAKYDIFPLTPLADPALEGTVWGPKWFTRLINGNGACLVPLPPPLWEVQWGDSSPIAMAWQPLVPGQFIAARYVKVRVTITEQTGHFQVIAPVVNVEAWVPLRQAYGSDTVAGTVATKVVTLAADPITGVSPWQNQMVVLLTSRTADQFVFCTTKANTANPPTFTVTHRDLTPGTPTPATDFDYYVTGY